MAEDGDLKGFRVDHLQGGAWLNGAIRVQRRGDFYTEPAEVTPIRSVKAPDRERRRRRDGFRAGRKVGGGCGSGRAEMWIGKHGRE